MFGANFFRSRFLNFELGNVYIGLLLFRIPGYIQIWSSSIVSSDTLYVAKTLESYAVVSYHSYFSIYLTRYKRKKYIFGERNQHKSPWNDIGLRLIWSKGPQYVWGVPKKKHKVWLWDFVPRHGHFFLQHLWQTDYTCGCCCTAVYLLKFPRATC